MMEASLEGRTALAGAALLQGQVVLLTGASRSIGAATALLLARHGAAVVVNYHQSAERARNIVEAIRAAGGRAIAIQASVEHAPEIEAMVQQVEQELGPIATLVLNAIASSRPEAETAGPGGNWTFSPLLDSTWERYQQIVMRILAGVYMPARIVAPLMVARQHGNLIGVSSTPLQRCGRSGCWQSECGSAAEARSCRNWGHTAFA